MEYVHAVTRGADWLPWQERGVSEKEKAFRDAMEARKSEMLSQRMPVTHPVLLAPEDIACAKKNIAELPWAKSWLDSTVAQADAFVAQPDAWVESMLPELSPAHGYGFTCPKCVGGKSQEAAGYSQAKWDYKDPDHLTCASCGQRFPDPAYPETATLQLPRSGQAITYYLNPAECAAPDDRSGAFAWHWVGHPIHVSFTGLIREQKGLFMRAAPKTLGLAYLFTGDIRYAERAKSILLRLAHCYRQWRYRDYWDTYADCDPLYAAWNDKGLPLEWKRHLCEEAYKGDTLERAAMAQTYWGAGRMHPSTDSVGELSAPLLGYDLIHDARRADGSPLWTDAERAAVERDFFLEYIMGAEPFVGGAGKAENSNNKSPRIYNAMGALGKCLGLPAYAAVALSGYEKVRDESFLEDGFSKESPAYTNMYLSQLLDIPETLYGFTWPEAFQGRAGKVDCYANDAKLGRMYSAVLQTLCPNGKYLPLSDTQVNNPPSLEIVLMGLRRYPGEYAGVMPSLWPKVHGEYALFHLSNEALEEDRGLPLRETLFPDWQTATLRHGTGTQAAVAALAFNPPGGHRHYDNLAVFYASGNANVLGEQGYLCDMPLNRWIHSTQSHNLVVVDDTEQRFNERAPEFDFMVTSPLVSVVEAHTQAYAQCTEYRRRVALIKGPEGQTLLLDLFRVAGGKKHDYRVYSDIASNLETDSTLEFDGVNMPPEPPFPAVAGSLADADIFGLRDLRSAAPQAKSWSATWKEKDHAFRLWMVSPADRVEAANGPGQRTLAEPGRRVRYVDAVRENAAESTFVAVHEPGLPDGSWAVRSVQAIALPASAGPRAVALQLDTVWGRYYVFHDLDAPFAFEGTTFAGGFGVFQFADGKLKDALTCGSAPGYWQSTVQSNTADTIVAATPRPAVWPETPDGAQVWTAVKTAHGWTGYPVSGGAQGTLQVSQYPLPSVSEFRVPAVGRK